MCCSVAKSASQNRIRSLVNIRWVRPTCLQFRWYLKFGSRLTLCSSLERYSIHMTNNSGDSGSPCLRPLPPWNTLLSWQLMWILKVTEVTQVIIHLMNYRGNFSANSISFKKSQCIESNSFCRPLAMCWQMRTLYKSSLPFTKAPWHGLIRLGSTSFILWHSSLEMHL